MENKLHSTITITNVSFQYNSTLILQDVNLTFKCGSFYLLIGPNGGGKTTLLKLIMGLLEPTKGEISIYERLPKYNLNYIGYIPQSFTFDRKFPISVKEFIMMGAISRLKWYGAWPAEILEKADKLLDEMEIKTLKDRQIGTLSGGQLQRAAMARALINNPRILLLDEPTNGLDVDSSMFIQQKLTSLKSDKTIIMVSHMISDIIDSVDEIECVQCSVEKITKNTICSHYKIGLYHQKFNGK